MNQFWIVVLIWYICVNENYLFTRAEYKSSTIPLNIENIQISCNNSLLLQIQNATVPQDNRSCREHKCLLNSVDINDIEHRCNSANVCNPNVNLTSTCLVEQPIGTYEISYDCKMMCDFESDDCPYVDAEYNGDTLNWSRTNVNRINEISVDHTNSENSNIMYVKSNKYIARMKIPIVKYEYWRQEWICINFWYITVGKTNPLILYKDNNELITEYNDVASDNVWLHISKDVYITSSTHIIFEANFRVGNGGIGLDDLSISMNECTETKIRYFQCGYWNENVTNNNCQSLFMSRLQIHYTTLHSSSADQQSLTVARQIASDVKTHCIRNYRLDYCNINLSNVFSSFNHTSPEPHKSIHIEYVCKENNTHKDDTTKAPTLSTLAKTQRTYPISETTTSVAILTQTVSSTPLRNVTTDSLKSDLPSSTPVTDTTDSLKSDLPSSTPVTGVVVGVVLSLVALSVILVIAFIYFRRTRYAEKKGHSIVANEDSQSDYTGHQNTAFSPDVDVTTQTDYCEIRTSKHNDQYHDITDTFSPSISTTNDDEYSEIANVANPPNSNPNLSINYQHQYISLDPNATGFDRSNKKTNLHNESKNNHNSDEKTSFIGGDDYAILDPDDLNESKNNTPKVLPLSENYVVLDPNETGFNRQENADTVCSYELATPINPPITSEDPYDVSKDETYDTSSNSRHTEKENNIYSHTVDNVYDTAGNQRKKEDNDGTYDHFFGQQSEDDYDISKPL